MSFPHDEGGSREEMVQAPPTDSQPPHPHPLEMEGWPVWGVPTAWTLLCLRCPCPPHLWERGLLGVPEIGVPHHGCGGSWHRAKGNGPDSPPCWAERSSRPVLPHPGSAVTGFIRATSVGRKIAGRFLHGLRFLTFCGSERPWLSG